MWRTVLFLIFTIVAVPIVTFLYDEPLNAHQWEILRSLLMLYGGASLLCFIVSSITDNYSQVDKLWSIMPIPYAWIMAHYAGYEPRIVLMAILISLWGIRLTYNFGRRDGYSWKFWTGEEDYRWSVLRAKPEFQSQLKWSLFNFFFISYYQMGLVLLITLPTLKAIGSPAPLGWMDYLLAVIILFLIVIEFIADQQQFDYQKAKYAKINAGEVLTGPYELGFTHTGLWAYMRHPNYMAEQAIWMALYFFSVIATGQWINWSIAGCLLLILLFKGSSDFSEEITNEKYPAYKRYIESVGRFLPLKGKFKI